MMNFKRTEINRLIVHKVGNKSRDEGLLLSESPYELEDDTLEALLLTYFLKPFKYEDYYQFNIKQNSRNKVHRAISDLFNNPGNFNEISYYLAEHLYEQSTHPKINEGELVVSILDNCFIEGEYVNAIGIFKSENKETYIKFNQKRDGLLMNYEKGINVRKLDKGCIIFNFREDDGYRILSIDNNTHDAQYWFKNFLGVEVVKNSRYKTQNALDLCERFVNDVIADELDQKDQMSFLNKSYDYIESQEDFDLDSYANDVIGEKEYIRKFNDYKNDYENKTGNKVEKAFPVEKTAISQARKKMKKFIKLDTNIQLKFNFDNPDVADEFVERGYDYEKDMHYYKVYFNEELD